MNASDSLVKSVQKTLAYFDLADFPLTKEELFSFLWESPQISYDQFIVLLPGFIERKLLSECRGYYVLPGREELVSVRQRRLLVAERKLKIARRAARIIRSVPFLKAVFVCNTVASEQATEDSDIDFFIIAEKNRIWLVRLFVTLLLGIFRLRRVGSRIKDKICLSFYITSDNLDLKNLRAIDDDIHFAYWIHQMLPIFDPEDLYSKFLQANFWTKKYLPNIKTSGLSSYIFSITPSKLSSLWKRAWELAWQGLYGDLVNGEAKKIQLSKMRFSGKNRSTDGSNGVVISDQVLKFHEKDTRLEYKGEWLQKYRELESNAYDSKKN